MDPSIKRHEYNRIMDAIRLLEISIDRDEATAGRMKHQVQSSFTISQLNKISQKNIDRKNRRDELKDRLKKLDAGLLDNELRENIKLQMKEAADKTRLTRQRKKALAANKEAKSVISKAYYQASRAADRKNRYLKKDMDRSYRHFVKACDSIPEYMIRNLSNMPNNKGYIWKSVACYGELPSEPGQPTVLFDRRRGGVMVIHEWTTDEYRRYEKQGKEQKVLVHKSIRKKRQLPPICEEVKQREKEEAARLSSIRKRSKNNSQPRNRSKRHNKKEGVKHKTKPQSKKKYGRGTWKTKKN